MSVNIIFCRVFLLLQITSTILCLAGIYRPFTLIYGILGVLPVVYFNYKYAKKLEDKEPTEKQWQEMKDPE